MKFDQMSSVVISIFITMFPRRPKSTTFLNVLVPAPAVLYMHEPIILVLGDPVIIDWPGLGLPRTKSIVVIPKKATLAETLTEKNRVKVRNTPATTLQKKNKKKKR